MQFLSRCLSLVFTLYSPSICDVILHCHGSSALSFSTAVQYTGFISFLHCLGSYSVLFNVFNQFSSQYTPFLLKFLFFVWLLGCPNTRSKDALHSSMSSLSQVHNLYYISPLTVISLLHCPSLFLSVPISILSLSVCAFFPLSFKTQKHGRTMKSKSTDVHLGAL